VNGRWPSTERTKLEQLTKTASISKKGLKKEEKKRDYSKLRIALKKKRELEEKSSNKKILD